MNCPQTLQFRIFPLADKILCKYLEIYNIFCLNFWSKNWLFIQQLLSQFYKCKCKEPMDHALAKNLKFAWVYHVYCSTSYFMTQNLWWLTKSPGAKNTRYTSEYSIKYYFGTLSTSDHFWKPTLELHKVLLIDAKAA